MLTQKKIKILNSINRQNGATLIGMVIVSAAVIFAALVTMKMFPAYQEYFSVKTVLHAMNKEPLNTMTKKEIMDSFNRRADAGYISVIKGSDLSIEKNGEGDTVVKAEYRVVKPLFANVSVLIDFSTSSDSK